LPAGLNKHAWFERRSQIRAERWLMVIPVFLETWH